MIASPRIQLLVALLAIVPLGCSFSYSLESSAKALASPFTSSSGSSGGASKQSYRDDVRDYTTTYFSSSSDVDAFERGLGDVARRHGVTNWEEDDATYVGIGAGLAKARVTAGSFEALKRDLAHGDPAKANGLQKGYDSYAH